MRLIHVLVFVVIQSKCPSLCSDVPHRGALQMLIRCPECRRQVSETANTCPRCGFEFDAETKISLKKKSIATTRISLGIIAGALILLWLVCAAATLFDKYEGHYVGGSQKEAYDKFQRGEHLSNSDVADLAGGPRRISPEEEQGAAQIVFNCCTVVFGLPGLIIVLYLYFTRGG
jgi:predicted RNA-binding Zn-ribbon protein involved in translation (DUF1610 family)